MAGAFTREVQQTEPLRLEAQATYVSNLKYAAEECRKVRETHGVTVLITVAWRHCYHHCSMASLFSSL